MYKIIDTHSSGLQLELGGAASLEAFKLTNTLIDPPLMQSLLSTTLLYFLVVPNCSNCSNCKNLNSSSTFHTLIRVLRAPKTFRAPPKIVAEFANSYPRMKFCKRIDYELKSLRTSWNFEIRERSKSSKFAILIRVDLKFSSRYQAERPDVRQTQADTRIVRKLRRNFANLGRNRAIHQTPMFRHQKCLARRSTFSVRSVSGSDQVFKRNARCETLQMRIFIFLISTN